ncbi:MAG: hypothetical protein ACRDBI_09220 [Shewanella sp.]
MMVLAVTVTVTVAPKIGRLIGSFALEPLCTIDIASRDLVTSRPSVLVYSCITANESIP